MQQLLLANPKSLHKRVMSHVFLYWFFVFVFCFCYLVALAIVPRSLHALLFLKSCLVFLASHLATFMPCTLLLSHLAPRCFHALHLVALVPRYTSLSHLIPITSHLATFVPCYTSLSCRVLFALRLIAFIFTLCYSHSHTLLFAPLWGSRLATMPLHLVVLPC
jgi:hypothetical protein